MLVKDNQVNSFESGGMNLDLSNLQIGTKDYTLALNATTVDNGSNQFIIRSKKGNTKVGNLPDGFFPIGVSEDNDNLAYIVSFNPDTNETEIGTYPSPNYYSATEVFEQTVSTTTFITTNAPYNGLFKITVTGTSADFDGSVSLFSITLGASLPIFDFTTVDLKVDNSRFELVQSTVFRNRLDIVVNSGSVIVKLEQITLNTTGGLVEEYHPLINLFPQRYVDRPDQYTFGNNNHFSVFRTTLLNSSLSNPVKIKKQVSYDDSINLILNDFRNTPRLINTRFTLNSSNTFTRIDRVGVNDTNIYSEGNFASTKLFLSNTKIPDLQFKGATVGGKLFGGNYKCYFRYADRDGNVTDFIEESLPVSVFNGNTVLDIRGTRGDERTNKKIRFTLGNVNTFYDKILVYYTFWGNNIPTDSVGITYLVNKDYLIQGNSSVDIEINGFESLTVVDQTEINPVFVNPNTVRDLEVIQNRLFLAGVKTYNFEFDDYVAFSQNITAIPQIYRQQGWGIVKPSLMTNAGLNTVIQTGTDDALSLSIDGYKNYNLGYYNPMNIYHSLGYFGTEAYQVGVCYIEKETGSLIGPFPIEGSDHLPFVNTTNTSGVVRFPDRQNIASLPMVQQGGLEEFNVFGIRMSINLNDPSYAAIKAKTNGMFFVRAKRKENLIMQGVMTAAGKALVSPTAYDLVPNSSVDDYSDVTDKYLYPLIGGYIESNRVNSSNEVGGAYFQRGRVATSTSDASFIDDKRFAFYSADYRTNPAYYNSEFLRAKTIYYKGQGLIIPYIESGFSGSGVTIAGADVPSLFGTTGYIVGAISQFEGNASSALVTPYSTVLNIQRFTSGFKDTNGDQGLRIQGTSSDDFNINLRYDSYLSLVTEDNLTVSRVQAILLGGDEIDMVRGTWQAGGDFTYPLTTRSWGYLINYYETNPASINPLDLYSDITQEQLYQISKRITWTELEATFGSTGTINVPVFGGDCFVNYNHLKVATNWFDSSDPTNVLSDIKNGYAIGFASENKFNTYLRDENEADVLETITYGTERSFIPYQLKGSTNGIFDYAQVVRGFKARIPETDQLNTGHKESTGLKIYSAPDTTVPFVVTNYTNTVFYTPEYIKENFANSFRVVYGLSQQTYNSELGEITSIHSYYNYMLLVFRGGIGLYPVNDRVPIVSEQGNVNIESIGVLAKSGKIISSDYGSKWTAGVIKTPFTVYGIDEELRLWRLEGDKIKLLDEYTVHGFLKRNVENVNDPIEISKSDIRLYYNPIYKEINFVFYKNLQKQIGNSTPRPQPNFNTTKLEEGNLGITGVGTFNLCYSEIRNAFAGFDTYIPLIGFNVGERFFSHNLYNSQEDIYEHNTGNNYAYWYGQYEDKFVIEFVVNKQSSMNKILDNLHIIGNKTAPESITYNADIYSNISHNIISRAAGNIRSYNHQYIENQHRIGCVRGTRDRLKDKYHRVRIVYPGGTNYTYVQAIISFFRYMFKG